MGDARQDDPGLFADPQESDEMLVNTDSETAQEEKTLSRACDASDADFSANVVAAGEFLRRRRMELGMDIKAVAAETFLKPRLIEAIEAGHLEDLPQPVVPVYIAGCVKKLGTLYKVDAETIEKITAGIKEHILCQAPDDVSKSCFGHEISEESIRRQRRLLAVLFTLLAAAVLLVAAGVIFLFMVFFREPDPVLNEPFSNRTLLGIQPEVKLDVTPLPVVE